jgi:lipid-A-disaccharide synthase-like uncharacterized protein
MMMNEWIVYAIGFIAQLLFSARLLLQWLASEKNKAVTTPVSFWMHSIAACILLFTYGYLRNDFPIMLGQLITYYIYIRNLQIDGIWYKQPAVLRNIFLIFPLLFIIFFFTNNRYDLLQLFNKENMPAGLLLWGSAGQVIFTFRFVYQWIYAEKIKQAILPAGFWWLSLTGCMMILTYAIIRKDPVLFIGQLFGFVVYARNLILIRSSEKA